LRNYEVGYGRPPMHSRFKKGECPNPKGRGKREPNEMADVIHNVLSEDVEYKEGPRIKRASKQELLIRKLFAAAIRGDVTSAGALLRLRVHAELHGDTGPLVIKIINDPDEDGYDQWIKRVRRPRRGKVISGSLTYACLSLFPIGGATRNSMTPLIRLHPTQLSATN
jgi:Family of unknown function (DUF5681)